MVKQTLRHFLYKPVKPVEEFFEEIFLLVDVSALPRPVLQCFGEINFPVGKHKCSKLTVTLGYVLAGCEFSDQSIIYGG